MSKRKRNEESKSVSNDSASLLDTNQNFFRDTSSSSLKAFVWGSGKWGQLGLGGNTRDRYEPVPLDDVMGVEWCQIVCGEEHTVGVTTNGQVFSWGRGQVGQLGHGEQCKSTLKPKLVAGLDGKKVIQASCGSNHTVTLTRGGDVYIWGEITIISEEFNFGEYTRANHLIYTPKKVEEFNNVFIVHVACGGSHIVAIDSQGTIYTWGDNSQGQLGCSLETKALNAPTTPERLREKKVVCVCAGGISTVCALEDGTMFKWGSGFRGRFLERGDSKFLPRPDHSMVGKKKIKQIACEDERYLICTEDGELYSFRLGDFEARPNRISLLKGKTITQLACGRYHTMVSTIDGRLYSWGNGDEGRLGHGSEITHTSPFLVERFIGHKVVQIASHDGHSVALVASKDSYVMRMKAMVNDASCSDIVFLVNNERVHACKAVLMAHSEYFQAMFRSNMKESKNNQIDIQDCSKVVFLLLLEYIYTSTVQVDIDHAVELYVLSDMYQVLDLSQLCLDVLERGLNCKNVLGLLVKAEDLRCDILKEVCVKFVSANFRKVTKNEGVRALPHSLLVDLLLNQS